MGKPMSKTPEVKWIFREQNLEEKESERVTKTVMEVQKRRWRKKSERDTELQNFKHVKLTNFKALVKRNVSSLAKKKIIIGTFFEVRRLPAP